MGGRGYIHGRYDGHGRTYDHHAVWARTRPPRLRVNAAEYQGRQLGTPARGDGFYAFNGRTDAFIWDNAPTAFDDDDQFSIVVRARMHDDNRFLCAYRYHLSRREFRTRGRDPLRVELDIGNTEPRRIVVTYDGAAGTGRTLSVYVDGKPAGSATVQGSPLSSYAARPLSIGYTEHSGGIYARVDVHADIRILDRVLTPEEVAERHTRPCP